MEIELFGSSYSFPSIKDGRFESLQSDIARARESLGDASGGRGGPFARKKTQALEPECRLELMNDLVGHYDELLAYLRSRIGDCRRVFEDMGAGVRASFEKRVRELEVMELRRAGLVSELTARGKGNDTSMLDAERDRIRLLTRNLAEASLLIIRKLRHALEALEVLASDGNSQRDTLEALRADVGMYRKVWEFSRDMNTLQHDIDSLTKTALNFDNLLRDNLGPLGVLVDEIAKVDSRVAESLAEIQALSERLNNNQALSPGTIPLGGNILDVLTGARVRADQLGAILERLGSDEDAPFDGFELELAGDGTLDFHALAENMSALVERGFRRLAGSDQADATGALALPAAENSPAEASADPPDAQAVSVQTPAWALAAQETARGDSRQAVDLHREPRPSAYRAAISRRDPTLIVFLLDRSGSMDTVYAQGQTRAEYLARTVDRALYELAVRCSRPDGVRDYFHIACLGYGDRRVANALPPAAGTEDWAPISRIAAAPVRLDEPPGGGKEPRWIEPVAKGDTPMTAAFEEACRLAARWCDAHPGSYPPTVINISDGESTDGNPSHAAGILGNLHTDDGDILVFNLHVGSGSSEIAYPSSDAGLDEHGRLLFSISSRFPPHLLARAGDSGYSVGPESRFFAYGAGAELATRFLELGTRPSSLR
ncbi:MAG: hypothetical protein KBB32_06340 [Spirochaetia bacterium]|nr:hypothetical protein [Spirochaetia bacterium]